MNFNADREFKILMTLMTKKDKSEKIWGAFQKGLAL